MSSRATPELCRWQIPKPAVLRSSGHRRLEIPGFRMFVTPFLHHIKIPELRTFANSRLHRLQASKNRESLPLKNILRELCYTQRFEGDGFSWIPQHHPLLLLWTTNPGLLRVEPWSIRTPLLLLKNKFGNLSKHICLLAFPFFIEIYFGNHPCQLGFFPPNLKALMASNQINRQSWGGRSKSFRSNQSSRIAKAWESIHDPLIIMSKS
jgi:hypothetical protein